MLNSESLGKCGIVFALHLTCSLGAVAQVVLSSIPEPVNNVVEVCLGSTVLFLNETDQSDIYGNTTFTWSLPNEQVSGTWSNFVPYTFDTPGTFQIGLDIVSNDGTLTLVGDALEVVVTDAVPPVTPVLEPGNTCTKTRIDPVTGVTIFQTESEGGLTCQCIPNQMGPAIQFQDADEYPENTLSRIYWGGPGSLDNGGTSPFTEQNLPAWQSVLSSFPGQINALGHYSNQGTYHLMHVVEFELGGCQFSRYYVMSWGGAAIDLCSNMASTVCNPDPFKVCFETQAPGTEYHLSWGDGADTTLAYPNLPTFPNDLSHTFEASCAPYDLSILATNQCLAGASHSQLGTISVNAPPVPEFLSSTPEFECVGAPVTFTDDTNPGLFTYNGVCGGDYRLVWEISPGNNTSGFSMSVVDGQLGQNIFSFSNHEPGSPEITIAFHEPGVYDVTLTALNADFSCQTESTTSSFTILDCGGGCETDDDSDGICDDVDLCVGEEDVCGVCNGPGAVFDCGCIGIPDGYCDCFGSQIDAAGICGGSCLEDDDGNGVCDDAEVLGCMYHWAINFYPEATKDDGSCESPCVGAINQNVFDWDGDSAVTIADFLAMLAVFGDVDVDSDGVWDSSDECTDLAACNYADDPSTPCQFLDVLGVCGGGCEADEDSDGVCDDIDDCIGVVDECGVCNGPGPTEVVIDDITIIYDSVYAEQIDQWFVFEVGADTTFSITCATSFSECGDPVSYQVYDYATVLIGEQCWFAENLRSENYENGDAIPSNLSDSEWDNTSSGAVEVYGEGSSTCYDESPDGDACDEAWSLSEYGRLYNWYAVDDARGLCPSGWHVPTDGEWMTMEMALGMSESEANNTGWRGTDQGMQMKSSYGWKDGGDGTNSSGFSGLPGGYSGSNGVFFNAGGYGGWWSSSPNGSYAWNRALMGHIYTVDRSDLNPRSGFSVRCVRDAE